MKKLAVILLAILILPSCKKEKDPVWSGTVTINNILYGSGPYYAKGLSVKTGAIVSTLDGAEDVISVLADANLDNTVRMVYMAVSNFENAFFKYGTYADATAASAAFDGLTSFDQPAWEPWATNLAANQVWLFRTSQDTYAKILVTAATGEKRDDKAFAECTIKWVYQPDGTLTFPAK
ncbi:MAG: hypothetical protein U0X39_05010 [Bacteroidales bacterium]